MKLLISKIAIAFGIVLIMTGCQKNSGPIPSGVTSLNVINTTVNSSGLIANINNQLPYYQNQQVVPYGGCLNYCFGYGNTHIALRQPSDTLADFFNVILPLPVNTAHSLFLTGRTEAPDSLFVTDNLPCHCGTGHSTTDSTTGIRIVNLSPGSAPVKVTVTGGQVNDEIENLAFKSITEFISYAATADVISYNFQFNDAATGDSLTTYTLYGVNNGTNGNFDVNNVRFKNNTIVFYGLPGSQSTFLVNNY